MWNSLLSKGADAKHAGETRLVCLDLNTSRVRAGQSLPGGLPEALTLDGHDELPLALSLEERKVRVGRAGSALARRLPHLGVIDFLPYLGEPYEWAAARHRLDAEQALLAVFEYLGPACAGSPGATLALPAYLTRAQRAMLTTAAEKTRLSVLGSVPAPLATALAAHALQPWEGVALVADADDHAFTWAAVRTDEDQAQLLDAFHLPSLGLRRFKERLLDALCDRCVRQSRWDPRDSGSAEQTLYDQLESAADLCGRGQPAELVIQTETRYHSLVLQPGDLADLCAPLVRQAVAELQPFLTTLEVHGPVRVVLLTAAAARLAGLVGVLEEMVVPYAPAEPTADLTIAQTEPVLDVDGDEDFGEHLLGEDDPEENAPALVCVLAPDAAVRALHDLAWRLHQGALRRGHHETVPLPPPLPVDAGPVRLHFRGQDYPLRGANFLVGRQAACDLVLDGERYPTVAPRHCEIVQEHRAYLVHDRSRHGTFVNDRPVIQHLLRPGDWIRLGPGGPLLRFLGQTVGHGKLMHTA